MSAFVRRVPRARGGHEGKSNKTLACRLSKTMSSQTMTVDKFAAMTQQRKATRQRQ